MNEKSIFLAGGEMLKRAALSFDQLLADLLFIRLTSCLGDESMERVHPERIYQILEVITTLDRHYLDPYELGAIILHHELNQPEKSLALLHKGIDNIPRSHPRYWYLPFHIAYIYIEHMKDYDRAAKYLEIASSFPQSPSYLPLLVARLYANTTDPGVALPFLQETLSTTKSQEIREQLLHRIKQIQIKTDLHRLNGAAQEFYNVKGYFPQHVKELALHAFLDEIPSEPFGGVYYIDQTNNTIRTTTNTDSLKLHIMSTTQTKNAQPSKSGY